MANILVVDDEEATRVMLGSAVKADGHTVAFAATGHRAVESFRAQAFDLIIMDIAMPDGNGLLATRDLVAEFPSAKVLVISGQNADQLDYALEYGAVDVMMKPINPRALQRRIGEILTDRGPWGDNPL